MNLQFREFAYPLACSFAESGSVSKFLVAQEMGRRFGNFLPYGTFAVSVIGALALGWLATIFIDRSEINSAHRLGIIVGFLGAFTTFSTFSLEYV